MKAKTFAELLCDDEEQQTIFREMLENLREVAEFARLIACDYDRTFRTEFEKMGPPYTEAPIFRPLPKRNVALGEWLRTEIVGVLRTIAADARRRLESLGKTDSAEASKRLVRRQMHVLMSQDCFLLWASTRQMLTSTPCSQSLRAFPW